MGVPTIISGFISVITATFATFSLGCVCCASLIMLIGAGTTLTISDERRVNDRLACFAILIGVGISLFGLLVLGWAEVHPLRYADTGELAQSLVQSLQNATFLSSILPGDLSSQLGDVFNGVKNGMTLQIGALIAIPLFLPLDWYASLGLVAMFLVSFILDPIGLLLIRFLPMKTSARLAGLVILLIIYSVIVLFLLFELTSLESFGLSATVNLRLAQTVLGIGPGAGTFFTLFGFLLVWFTLIAVVLEEIQPESIGKVKRKNSPSGHAPTHGSSRSHSNIFSIGTANVSAPTPATHWLFPRSNLVPRLASLSVFGGTAPAPRNSSRPTGRSTVPRHSRASVPRSANIGLPSIALGVGLIAALFLLPMVASGGQQTCNQNIPRAIAVLHSLQYQNPIAAVIQGTIQPADGFFHDTPVDNLELGLCHSYVLIWWWQMVLNVSGFSTLPFALGVLLLSVLSITLGLLPNRTNSVLIGAFVALGCTLIFDQIFRLSIVGGFDDFWLRLLSAVAEVNVTGWYWLLVLGALMILPVYRLTRQS